MRRLIFLMIGAALFLSACVPARKLEDVQSKNTQLQIENDQLKKLSSENETKTEELNDQIADLTKQISKLTSDTAYYGERYRKIEALNDHLNTLYEKLIAQNEQLLSNSSAEKMSMSDSLRKQQNELLQKEIMLNNLQKDLQVREQKLAEMQKLLKQKDSITQALKAKITQALVGFESSDLTIEEKGGRIYVSMAEKLLFKTGSTAVDPKGVDALEKLAEVLKKNTDINISVEGHTDNVPLSGSGAMKDNWDLSVLRATSIVRILTQNGVSANQITPSGKGESQPVASNDTAEGRAKNRRSEIIISPNLSEVLKVVTGN